MSNLENKEIQYGYCHCGCGNKTTLQTSSWKAEGRVKNEPARFIQGHNLKDHHHLEKNSRWKGGRKKHQKYIVILMPNHPRANYMGYVREHILLAEKAMGKFLPPGVVVHHHTPTELVVCQDQVYHMFIERRTRAFRACGHANWIKCRFCKQHDDPLNMYINKKGYGYHRECMNRDKRIKRNAK